MGLDQESEVLSQSMTSGDDLPKSFPRKEMCGKEESIDRDISMDRVKLDMVRMEKKPGPDTEAHSSLKQEILQLEKRLLEQVKVRCALEAALGFRSSSFGHFSPTSMPKPATELIKEIAVLELEVVYLEQYLLSLYRKAFDQQVTSVSSSTRDKIVEADVETPQGSFLNARTSQLNATSNQEQRIVRSTCQSLDDTAKNTTGREENQSDSEVNRCHSALPQSSGFAAKTALPLEGSPRALRACHSEPFALAEYAENTAQNVLSLAEHLGARISDHVPETPNRLSEDMIRCMSAIYCKLAESPLMRDGLSLPFSSLSSPSGFSQREPLDMWSPGFGNSSSFDVRLDNPFRVEGLREFSGPHSTMVEVPWLHRDSRKLGEIEHMLQDFRSLIGRLEEVDPRKLRHEEKLAFWINIHNALLMHAFLAYGIPKNSTKRLFLLLKAAYNVGGHTISAGTLQSSILGCRMCRPNQWLRLLLTSKTKFKAGDDRQAYAIDRAEPLLHFALCCGNHSDPAIRLFTPKRVLQELETAKGEYIQATFGIRKDRRVLLPKLVESFAKDSGLCPMGLVEMVQQALPEYSRKSLKNWDLGKSRKNIEWVSHNFNFRYLIPKELAK
ncbi:uncharacterized protein LOC116198891 isoform X2 [Punica granatum]|uniref:Uncharacterized protein LOC116198891 isoform X2 n=1 Tax=Punica granatum TaxID=22663 RepID=A0A6P8CNC3_PUNGR|nr:uncharacterized protein LOC116198891 isoform X2 [Punica granatum]